MKDFLSGATLLVLFLCLEDLSKQIYAKGAGDRTDIDQTSVVKVQRKAIGACLLKPQLVHCLRSLRQHQQLQAQRM